MEEPRYQIAGRIRILKGGGFQRVGGLYLTDEKKSSQDRDNDFKILKYFVSL